jgi:hypothetical protein
MPMMINPFWFGSGGGGGDIPGPFNGALVKLAANYVSPTNHYALGAQQIPFDEEIFDDGGWHDNSTNNFRLTVPSGVSYVVVSCTVRTLDSITGLVTSYVTIRKNGGETFIGVVSQETNLDVLRSHAVTGAIPVTAGDYFEVWLDYPNDSSVTIDADGTWFQIEAIP